MDFESRFEAQISRLNSQGAGKSVTSSSGFFPSNVDLEDSQRFSIIAAAVENIKKTENGAPTSKEALLSKFNHE